MSRPARRPIAPRAHPDLDLERQVMAAIGRGDLAAAGALQAPRPPLVTVDAKGHLREARHCDVSPDGTLPIAAATPFLASAVAQRCHDAFMRALLGRLLDLYEERLG